MLIVEKKIPRFNSWTHYLTLQRLEMKIFFLHKLKYLNDWPVFIEDSTTLKPRPNLSYKR